MVLIEGDHPGKPGVIIASSNLSPLNVATGKCSERCNIAGFEADIVRWRSGYRKMVRKMQHCWLPR